MARMCLIVEDHAGIELAGFDCVHALLGSVEGLEEREEARGRCQHTT
jgi:hypothetical protein